jgi:hypothetical protein
MRKLSLLLGTMGGALAGYLFSNRPLREELSKAKDAEAAGRVLAKHLAKDGKQIGSEVKKFVESDEVQDNLAKAKVYVKDTAKKMQGELSKLPSMIQDNMPAVLSMHGNGGAKKPAAKKHARKAA